MTTISIRNVSKSYDDVPVIRDLSLEIPTGKFTSLLGPSGCGKTTLLRMIAGFHSPDSGEIMADGKVLATPMRSVAPEKRDIGMVFQQYAIWPHMNVFKNVAFGLEMAKVAKRDIPGRVREALVMVGLEGYERRGSSELSGGQQQRLALARALVTRPSVLLLDEPLSNLDSRLRERMRVELRELQRQTGITFVYVTHDRIEAMSMSDSIAILNDGVVAQVGAPEELYDSPVGEFVIDFLGLTNWFAGRVERVGATGGSALVRLPDGALLAGTAAPGLRAGQPVRVAVRPEDLDPTDRAGSENIIAGTVSESLFMGSFVHHHVDVAGRSERVVVQTGRSVRLPRGSAARFHAAPELVRVVAAPETGVPAQEVGRVRRDECAPLGDVVGAADV